MATIREVAVVGYSTDGYNGQKVPVDSTHPLPTTSTGGTTDTLVGAVNETAPATDTASSGLNGRLQRIAQRLTSLIALLPASLGAKTSAASLSIVPASDATFGSPVDVITVTPTVLNADAYDAGDTVFDATVITGAVRVSGGSALLQSIVVADKDDQKAQLRLVFFDSTVTFGTADSAPSLSDADSLKCVGSVEILAADYIDFGGVSVATKTAIGLLCKASGSANLYVAAMTSGTPTYTTGGLQLRLGFLQA